MPKKVMDYSKCLIYKIVCNDLLVTDCYVGHTTNFKQRKSGHKSSCNLNTRPNYNCKVYQFIRDNGGWNNWSMIEIQKYPCNDFNEATARERYWYEILNANLNICIPNRSKKDYYQENKEELLKKQKIYQKNNKEEIIQIQKIYIENNKEQIKKKRKEYYEKNKVERLLYHKEWSEKNKEHIKNYNDNRVKEEVTCECGIKCCKTSLKKHQSRQIHIDNLASKV
jgi:hypothetical protein